MAKPNSSYEELARDAAARLDEAKAAGQQLTFLPDENRAGESSKSVRGKGKATSQLRDWLAARGMRLPEDVIADMAGLASSGNAMLTAMAAAEQMTAWAQSGAATEVTWVNDDGEEKRRHLRSEPTLAERMEAFKFFYTVQLRAAEALLPYGLAKVTPDAGPTQVVQVVVAGGGGQQASRSGPDGARDVTPKGRQVGPPPMPHEMQQKQPLSQTQNADADDEARTK